MVVERADKYIKIINNIGRIQPQKEFEQDQKLFVPHKGKKK